MQLLTQRGAEVPALGFGTYLLEGSDCRRMVPAAIEIGYRHIDTAKMYHNETEVGQGLKTAGIDREAIFLTTKLWRDQLAYKDALRATEDSLRQLNTEYVDLLLIHWPNQDIALGETLDALHKLKDDGKTRHIGVSNFNVALLKQAIDQYGAELLCNQVEYHPFLSQQPVLDWLRDHDMFLTAYSPLARGDVLKDSVIQDIERHGKNPIQITLRWMLDQSAVAVIPKASSEAHARSNFEIFDFQLSDEDTARIDALDKTRRLISPEWAPEWDNA